MYVNPAHSVSKERQVSAGPLRELGIFPPDWDQAGCSLGFPGGSAGKESACNAGDLGSVPGLGRSPGEGKGYPLQYFGLENSMDCIVHVVAKSQTQLSDFHFRLLSSSCLEMSNGFWPDNCSDSEQRY